MRLENNFSRFRMMVASSSSPLAEAASVATATGSGAAGLAGADLTTDSVSLGAEENRTKWLMFCRQHFQIYFLQ